MIKEGADYGSDQTQGSENRRRGDGGRNAAGLLTSPMQIPAVDVAECSKRRSRPEAVHTF